MKHLPSPLLIAIVAAPALIAQAPAFKLGAVYECAGGQSYKIISCAGPKTTDVCEVQSYAGGEPTMRGQSSRQQVTTMLARCHAPAPAAAAEKVAASESKTAAKPPRPGLTSCAGKIEGRYAASNGTAYTITFRAGKAIMSVPLMGNDESECWTSGGKIYLHKPSEDGDVEIDINDDGTLQTPFGELKKKAK